jgi:2,3-bisphosphoglycerate-dependent phosphoglycerate mutase
MNTIHRFDLTKKRFPINRAARFLPLACAVALMLPVAPILGSGLTGRTYASQSNGSPGPTIANVTLVFVKENDSSARKTISDASGYYSISLDPGRYYTLATHPDHEDDTSTPGFSVVSAGTEQTRNFILRKPGITTVLVGRHAEKVEGSSLPDAEIPLTDNGQTRARQLDEILFRSGVSAVYSTKTLRTRETVKRVAHRFRLTTQDYNDGDLEAFATSVLAKHRGDVVLVAAHSPTVGAVANAFGGDVSPNAIGDFDNLYVVSVSGKTSKVVNLQYAADSPPVPSTELTKNSGRGMTLLLVGTSAGSNPQDSQDLLHAARKAGVTNIFKSAGSNSLVAPLATALSLTPATFIGSDMPSFANQLISNHTNETVVVAGKKAELQELIRQLGGSPPMIYDTDIDHLIMVTRFKSGAIRVVPMRF